MEADSYKLELNPDKLFFKMEFGYGGMGKSIQDFEEKIIDFFDSEKSVYAKNLNFFITTEGHTCDSDDCGYSILNPFDEDDFITEQKKWLYGFSDYNDSREVNSVRFDYINKRRDLWLLEGKNDTALIKKAKEDLAAAEKKSKKHEGSNSDQNEDNNYDTSDDLTDMQLYKLGIECYKNNDLDGAINAFNKSLTICPDDTSLLNELANVYLRKKDYANALKEINKAIELEPIDANYWDSRAEIYEAMGEYEKAIADCKKALELDPDKDSSKEILERCQKELKSGKPKPATPPSSSGTVCPSCGKTARQGAKFCAGCGTKFEPVCARCFSCANCGRQLKATSKFCPGCGTKV